MYVNYFPKFTHSPATPHTKLLPNKTSNQTKHSATKPFKLGCKRLIQNVLRRLRRSLGFYSKYRFPVRTSSCSDIRRGHVKGPAFCSWGKILELGALWNVHIDCQYPPEILEVLI